MNYSTPDEFTVRNCEYFSDPCTDSTDIRLFDDSGDCYDWRVNLDYSLELKYNTDNINDVRLETFKDDSDETFDIPEECLNKDILHILFNGTTVSKCNGTADEWVSLTNSLDAEGFGGAYVPLCEVNLVYEQVGPTPVISIDSPLDEATDVSTAPTLIVDVSDDSGNDLTISFHEGNSDTIACDVAYDGTQAACQWNGREYATEYEWYINVSNTINEVSNENDLWSFTTAANNIPTVTSFSPDDGAIDQDISSFQLSVTISDIEEELMNVNFIGYESGATEPDLNITIDSQTSGSTILQSWTIEYNKTYEWYVVLIDGVNEIQQGVWTFTTLEEAPLEEPVQQQTSSPGGSSSGGGLSEITTSRSFNRMSEGTSRSFLIDGRAQTLEVTYMGGNYVNVTLASKQLILFIDDSQKIDLDGDDTYDIEILLTDINSGRAYIKITKISEGVQTAVVEEPEPEPISEPEPAEEETTTDTEISESDTTSSPITGAFAGFAGDLAGYRVFVYLAVAVIVIYALIRRRGRLLKKVLRFIFRVKGKRISL